MKSCGQLATYQEIGVPNFALKGLDAKVQSSSVWKQHILKHRFAVSVCVRLAFLDGILGHVSALGVEEKGHLRGPCRKDGVQCLPHPDLVLFPLPGQKNEVK